MSARAATATEKAGTRRAKRSERAESRQDVGTTLTGGLRKGQARPGSRLRQGPQGGSSTQTRKDLAAGSVPAGDQVTSLHQTHQNQTETVKNTYSAIIVHLQTRSKVGQANVTIHVQKDVVGFNVSVSKTNRS